MLVDRSIDDSEPDRPRREFLYTGTRHRYCDGLCKVHYRSLYDSDSSMYDEEGSMYRPFLLAQSL